MAFVSLATMKIVQHTYLLIAATALFLGSEDSKPAKPTTAPVVNTIPADDVKRESIIAYAKQYLGIRYKYASGSPAKGFDCSGFVNFVYKHFNIEVPRSSSGFTKLGKSLKPEQFRVGDILVFYGYRNNKSVGHVGIVYEANGMKSKFIHASSGKEMAVTVSDLGSEMYTRRFYKCISPLSL
jgi:cell wall-associated NlpC family hydrolase